MNHTECWGTELANVTGSLIRLGMDVADQWRREAFCDLELSSGVHILAHRSIEVKHAASEADRISSSNFSWRI